MPRVRGVRSSVDLSKALRYFPHAPVETREPHIVLRTPLRMTVALGMPGLALSQLAWAHAHETLLWASRSRSSRHTFNYELLNAPHPASQMSSVWRIPAVPICEKRLGYHHSHAASLHEVAWPRTPRSRLLQWRPGGGCGLTRAARIAQARARASRRDRVGIAQANA
jgi:hypothetical protein